MTIYTASFSLSLSLSLSIYIYIYIYIYIRTGVFFILQYYIKYHWNVNVFSVLYLRLLFQFVISPDLVKHISLLYCKSPDSLYQYPFYI